MGAAASARRAGLTEVEIQNEIGVLFDGAAESAFRAQASTDGIVPWTEVRVFARAHGLDDPKAVLFANLTQFKRARKGLEDIYKRHFTGAVRGIAWRPAEDGGAATLGDEHRQRGLDGKPAATLDALYAIAEKALVAFKEVVTKAVKRAVPGGVSAVQFATLKGRARAAAKARDDYAERTGPPTSWLFDVVRGSVVCKTEKDLVSLYARLDADPAVDIVRTKNRFNPPEFNGYRDLLLNLAVKVVSAAGAKKKQPRVTTTTTHLCELQIHHVELKASDEILLSHKTYVFFRAFFVGNKAAVEYRLAMLVSLPVDDGAKTADDLVDRMLGGAHRADRRQLEALVALLQSVAESAAVVRVYEHLRHLDEREFGRNHRVVAVTLANLGNAYGSLGDAAKQRDLLGRALVILEREHGRDHRDVALTLNNLGNAYGSLGDAAKQRALLERALAIKEREYGRDHRTVAATLNNLGNAYGTLGDAARQRDLLERALVILEREFGPDHRDVAFTLRNLASAYGDLGDAAKKRDLLGRALVILEREFGCDHSEVAVTLNNLGNAHGDLGDAARQRDLLERALVIQEREFGRDHRDVAVTLNNLGNAHGDLGHAAKQRDLLERALAILEREFGRDHRNLAATLTNLGNAHGSLGDAARQRDLLERALVIDEREYGRDHRNVAATLNNLGVAHGRLGDAAKQRGLLERALAIEEREYGRDHRDVATTLTNLGLAYGRLGDAAKQRDLLERALAIQEREYGVGHREVATTLNYLAMAYGSLGDAAKQRGLLARALVVFEREYGRDHAYTRRCRQGLSKKKAAPGKSS